MQGGKIITPLINEIKKCISPELLVYVLQNGGINPFEMLLGKCNPSIKKVTSKYYLQDYDREDFQQESRIVLFKAVKKYKASKGMDFIPFYEMTLSNHMNMLIRRECTHKRKVNMTAYSLDEMIEKYGGHLQGEASIMTQPEELMLAREILNQYIVELSPFETKVFLLFLKGRKQEDICVELKCSLQKVKNALYRCTSKYRNILK